MNFSGNVRAALAQDGLDSEHKFGHSALIGTTLETIWDGGVPYVYPAAAVTMTVSSSSAVDAYPAGAGARTVEVFGLDSNYEMASEILELDGQTEVTIPTDLVRVFRVAVLTDGSLGVSANTGDIYVGVGAVASGIPATVYAKVLATKGQTLMALYTIPKGFTGLLYSWKSNTGRLSDATVEFYKRPFGGVFRVQDVSETFEGSIANTEVVPIKIAEKTDLEARAKAASGTISVGFRFSLALVPNVD